MNQSTHSRVADLEQIRRAHAHARPKPGNPAWWNCHRDLGVVLAAVDEAAEAMRERAEKAAWEVFESGRFVSEGPGAVLAAIRALEPGDG